MYLMSSEKHSACDTLEAELTDIQAAVASNTHTQPAVEMPSLEPPLSGATFSFIFTVQWPRC